MDKLTRRYGLFTAICMVVGTVIGSGVFFKAQDVLARTGGNMTLGILAWVITGMLMIICCAQFAVMATRYQKVSGVVDYAEATCGKSYAYYLAWFLANIYYPAMAGVLAWVTARYFGVLFGWNMVGSEVFVLAGFFLIASYTLNAFSPKLAGKFQVSATVIKLIPIALLAVVGTAVGTAKGTLPSNFANVVSAPVGGTTGSGLFAAIMAAVFAYEGWIVATSINAELKDSKKNLPLALVLGAIIVVAAYVLYFIGTAGGASTADLIENGASTAFTNIFGGIGGTLLNICIVISCMGTLNGLLIAVTRGMYAIAVRNEGPDPQLFSQVDQRTNMVTNSAIWGLFISAAWLVYFYGANLSTGWFGVFDFDSSELPIVTIYAMYIPMLIMWMKKEKDLGVFKRFVLPGASVVACLFMIFAAVYAHGVTPYLAAKAEGKFSFPVLFYLIVFAVIMVVGAFLKNPKTAGKDR
ncbi:MAG: APC family permease [Oscillospiraceae bacterium]|nr:APC family permease [Oscillospiraceae bacterium]MBQ8797571.1 APC family permease [Oscillospiraceae bacterium]